MIALWRKTGVDGIITYRAAADNSFDNECEGVMPLLNLALQHQSTQRTVMAQEYEALIKSAGSMSKIRTAVEAESEEWVSNFMQAWQASMRSNTAIGGLGGRMAKLEYTGKPVQVREPAATSEMEALQQEMLKIDPLWSAELTTQKDLP